jgi:O-antigen ligase
LIGVAEYLLGYAELRWVDVARFSDIGGRVCGPFSNPNIFAVYLLGVAPILLSELTSAARPVARRLGCGFGFLMSCGAIVFTFTRGAWLGILVALFVFFLCLNCRSAAWLTLAAVPMISLLPMLPKSLINRFLSIGSLSESSACYRLHTWRGVLRLVVAHPFGIGVGEEAFLSAYRYYAVSGTERVMHAHNLFLQILSEQGVVGFLLFLCLLVLLFLCGLWKKPDVRDPRLHAERLGVACAMLAILVMGLFDHVWYHFGMLCLFFILAAMLTLPAEEFLEREMNL